MTIQAHLFISRAALLVLALTAVLLPFGAAASPTAATDLELDRVLQSLGERLGTVSSDAKALAVFSAHIGPALDLLPVVSELGSPPAEEMTRDKAPAQNPTPAAVRLVAELAALRLATAIKEAAGSSLAVSPLPLSELLHASQEQRAWLLTGDARRALHQAVRMGTLLSSIQRPQPTGTEPNSVYTAYASYLDRTYPNLTEADSSWLALAERDGAEGVRRRLLEFWRGRSQGEGAPSSAQVSEEERGALATRYFDSRLRPIFTARLAGLSMRAQAEAEHAVYKAWEALARWHEHLKELRGQARLCGTWQWTVHNHQNHQDHKMMLTFAPQDAQNVAGPRPSKIVVLGDVVFLRWEFPRGYQEDSLLFSNEGQRLEGTFVNSAGAWGSISGKRTAPCKK